MTGNKIKHFSEIHILIFTTGKPEMWLFLTAWGTHIPIKVPSPVKICKSLLSVTPAHVKTGFAGFQYGGFKFYEIESHLWLDKRI